MTEINPHARWLRPLIIFGTALLAWSALIIGQQFTTVTVEAGDPSPETFLAESAFAVEDTDATDLAIAAAVADVDLEYMRDTDADLFVVQDIQTIFAAVAAGTVVTDVDPLPEVSTTTTVPVTTTVAESTTTTLPPQDEEEEVTTTTVAPVTTEPEVERTSGVVGVIFIDIDADATFTEVDEALPGVRITAYDSTDLEFSATSAADGSYAIFGMATGTAQVLIETSSIHDRLSLDDTDVLLRSVDLGDNQTEEFPPVLLTVLVVSAEDQTINLDNRFFLSDETKNTLVALATEDVAREILGKESWLLAVEQEAIRLATEQLDEGILQEDLDAVQNQVRTGLSFVPLPESDDSALRIAAGGVAREIAALRLIPNTAEDEVLTQQARDAAAATVDKVYIEYTVGDRIIGEGEIVTVATLEILVSQGLLTRAAPRYAALASVVLLVVLMLSFYLGRFRPLVWQSMRRMALFGMLTVLAALSARLIAVFAADSPAAGYLIPAAAFGLMAAILFDARIAVLMSMVVGSMTAIATLDPGYTLFATLGTLTPVPFVSSISARRELRVAVFYMIFMLAALAGGTAWFFQDGMVAQEAALYGALNGFLSGLVGSALLSFFEIIFDVTTSLRLLDLTDRNHPGLRLLEDKAIGTFNHSLMVGTLADQAARAVDANALLARAAAYYHDLGKTENPQFFIENQFGIQNPHDRMPPEESANVIRQHVIDGRRLSKHFRIPAEVADGVITHHGDGIMHFFYAKAVERYGEERVDIEDYRHVGRKPTSKEMAIVMMADSVEGACRAIFQVQEPSPERITEVVERVVGEKVDDGQLSECSLTLGDLTRAKEAMVEALIGYYHQRIPYPNFPTRTRSSAAITIRRPIRPARERQHLSPPLRTESRVVSTRGHFSRRRTRRSLIDRAAAAACSAGAGRRRAAGQHRGGDPLGDRRSDC